MIIRLAKPDDAGSLLVLNRAVIEDGRGVVMSLDDLPSLEDKAQGIINNDDRLHLVAVEETVIIGEAICKRFAPKTTRHAVMLAIEVHPRHQRQGIGRRLMDALLAWCESFDEDESKRVHRIELYVRADNHRALSLYRSLGFEQEGVRRNFIRLENGSFVDDLTFAKLRFC